MGIQINDPDLWSQLKSGELTGISLAGIARHEPEPDDPGNQYYTEKDTAPSWATRLIKALTGAPSQEDVEETDMNEQEVTALVSKTLTSVLPDALKEAMKAAGDPPAATEPTEIEKAIAAALKAAGVEPKEPAAEPAIGETDITKAVDAAVQKAIGTKVDDAITKALAKGATETDPSEVKVEESFV